MINMDIIKITAVNLEVASKKGKEKLEHFGVKLEEEKEYHDRKLFHPMQPNEKSIQYNNIKIKEEETSSTSRLDQVRFALPSSGSATQRGSATQGISEQVGVGLVTNCIYDIVKDEGDGDLFEGIFSVIESIFSSSSS
nr:hypothetical protein [Tanacetum cinerariifolium]